MNSKNPIVISAKDSDFNAFVADYLFEIFKELQSSKKSKINIALSGGTTPLPILEILKTKEINWEQFNFFMVDERLVSLNSPSSNYGNINNLFFKYICSLSFSMIKDHFTYEESLQSYRRDIIDQVLLNQNGVPVFDLILLGIGDDGHTASLFPKTEALTEFKEIVVLNKVPQLDSERITLTYPVILNSKQLIVITKGESKKKIIDELYSKSPPDYPVLKIVQKHLNLKWLID